MHFDFDDFFGGVGGGSRYRYFKWRWRPAVAGRGGGAFSFLCFFVCWLWNPGMRINYSKIAKRRLKSTKITILFLRIDKKKKLKLTLEKNAHASSSCRRGRGGQRAEDSRETPDHGSDEVRLPKHKHRQRVPTKFRAPIPPPRRTPRRRGGGGTSGGRREIIGPRL